MRNKQGQFIKGCSGNYSGRPPISKKLALAYETSKLQPASYIEIINKYLFMPVKELESMKQDKTLSTIDYALVSVLIEVIYNGDIARLDCLLNRVVGRPPQQIDIQALSDHNDKWDMLPKEEQEAIRRELRGGLRTAIEEAREAKALQNNRA